MKLFRKVLGIILILLANFSCGQTLNEDNSNIEMLTNFYNSYNAIFATEPPLHHEILDKKLDSLVSIYCTVKLQNEARKYWDYGHDIMTDDYGACKESLSSLKIVKNHSKENFYSISYNVFLYPVPNRPELKEISFNVALLKENDSYKIDEIVSNIEH